MYLDLSSLKSVIQFTKKFKSTGLPINYLILNAATMGNETLTEDGYEIAFGVNFIANYLLTNKLTSIMQESKTRISVLVSENLFEGNSIDYSRVRLPCEMAELFQAYLRSKLALHTWAYQYSKRYEEKGITINCVFPGYCGSNLYRELPETINWLLKRIMYTVEDCAMSVLYTSVSKDLQNLSGLYINGNYSREEQHSRFVLKNENGSMLWAMCEAWVYSLVQEEENKKDII